MSTIAAIATAPGEGGIAILRLSGPESKGILADIVTLPSGRRLTKPRSHHMYYGMALDGQGGITDEVMAVFMPSPHSYTREDVAEIHCHGGRTAAGLVLDRALSLGASLAQPGEFTRRAFENGRIDLSQAEAVMGVIAAGSQAALRASVRELEGGVSHYITLCRSSLSDMLAAIEAADDFPDEIDEPATAADVLAKATALRQELMSRCNDHAAHALREGISVVLCGRPNVGKSSILNALSGTDSAIVTSIPGTTRDVMTVPVTLSGLKIDLSDTAGQRASADEVEKIGVSRAIKAMEHADMVIFVLDGSQPLTQEDADLLARRGSSSITVMNKCDLPMHPDFDQVCDVSVSAATGAGLTELKELLLNKARHLTPADGQFTRQRHIDCARQACVSIDRATDALSHGLPLDVAAVDLWDARRALGQITGEDATEDVIDAVFAQFCVGK